MAEASLRLFRGRSWQRCVEEGIPGGRNLSAQLPPSCRLLNTRQGVVFFSRWARSSENGSRRNGAADSVPPLYRSPTAYYDILEVSGKATQAQIKTAYYKQSFRFHPDRNSGDEASARQFGLVTEAYNILGSVSLRKKYDRGTLSLSDVRSAKKPNGKSSGSTIKDASGQRETSGASASNSPVRPMFDFDAFYQAHYGEQLAREQLWKERREHIEKKKQEKNLPKRLNRMNEFSALLLFLSATVLLVSLRG